MNDREDATLVADCLNGNRQSFETLLDRYQKLVFNLALRIVNDRDEAADVTQTVFIKAYENLHRFNPRYKFYSWIYRIATNESLNIVKARKPVEALSDELESSDLAPDALLGILEDSRLMEEALGRLTPENRAVVVLCHVNGLSYREIGDVLEISEKKVKSRLFSARKQLKTLLLKLRS
ncbi:MAG TPA: RNA polymerase sigma factor [Bacteroidota bacterium]|nr:RNA polymerase sigma factor [Bacteroidota bacterium]